MRTWNRLTTKIDKITCFDMLLHLLGIHLFRIKENKVYCRICGKTISND
jgi:hypothetical protein